MNIPAEFRRYIRNKQYEPADEMIIFPNANAGMRSEMLHWVGKNGPYGEQADLRNDPNRVVNQGLNYFLDSALSNGTVFSTWYIAPYKNNYTPQAGDAGVDFPTSGKGNEATTEYDEVTRVQWIDAGAASQSITNTASPAVFTFNTTVSIYGAFMISGSTKGSTSNSLLAASLFSSVRNMDATSQLNIVYSFTIADV